MYIKCAHCLKNFEIKPYRFATAKYCSRKCRGMAPTRFWAKVNKNGTIPDHRPDLGRCWIWTGTCNNKGYGRFVIRKGECAVPHRYIYECLHGLIPEGLQIDHLCRDRACVNPQHLELVTGKENVGRGWAFRGRKSRCIRNHPLSGRNLYIGTGNRHVCRICHQMKTNESRNRKKSKPATDAIEQALTTAEASNETNTINIS